MFTDSLASVDFKKLKLAPKQVDSRPKIVVKLVVKGFEALGNKSTYQEYYYKFMFVSMGLFEAGTARVAKMGNALFLELARARRWRRALPAAYGQ